MAVIEFGSILWLEPGDDIHITKNIWQTTLASAHKSGGIQIFGFQSRRPLNLLTHPQMFLYLPTNPTRASGYSFHYISGLLLYNTKIVRQRFLKWLVLCSLDANCISPKRSTPTCGTTKRRKMAAISNKLCHKYDLSAMNIILNNLYNYDSSHFINPTNRIIIPNITPNRPKYCASNNN